MTKVRLLVANADFNAGNNKALVQQCCEWADVLALVEAKDFLLADVLPSGWKSLQNTSDDAHKGSCLAVRTSVLTVVEHYTVLGCEEPKDGGMLSRFIAVAELRTVADDQQMVAMAAHYPPERHQDECGPEFTANLQAAWNNNKTRRPAVGMDANMPIKEMAKKLIDARGYGVEVMGWCVRDTLPVTDSLKRAIPRQEGWTDHPAFQVNVDC